MHRLPNTPSQLHEMNEIQLYETIAPPPHETNEIQQHAERRAPRTSYAMQKETTHRPPEDLHNKGEEKTEATAKSTQPPRGGSGVTSTIQMGWSTRSAQQRAGTLLSDIAEAAFLSETLFLWEKAGPFWR